MAQFLLGNSIFTHLFRWIIFVDCLLVRNIVVLLFFGQCEQWRRGGSPLRVSIELLTFFLAGRPKGSGNGRNVVRQMPASIWPVMEIFSEKSSRNCMKYCAFLPVDKFKTGPKR